MHIFHGKIPQAGSSCSLWHIQTWKLGKSRQGCCRTCGCVCDRPQDWETTGEWGVTLPKPPASTEGDCERFPRRNPDSSISLAFVTLLILRMYTWDREAETALISYNVYFVRAISCFIHPTSAGDGLAPFWASWFLPEPDPLFISSVSMVVAR